MDIFDYARSVNSEKESPLASRLRPKTLDQVVGQEHIIGKDKLLYRAIKADKISSIIFYGPPGTGKTTLAKVIANTTSADFMQLNATVAGKKDMEDVVAKAKQNMAMSGRKTILFVDEIHRFNKGQQDYLLPFVEDGTVVLIGATTENPYFEVNSALISRSIVFELHPLSVENIKTLILRAVNDKTDGMGIYNGVIDDDAVMFLAEISNGDARTALNAVELGILTTDPAQDGKIHITDPDAAVYYLSRMLYAGESVDFISRRILICAAEDVGMANPQALVVANAAAQAVHQVGMPEAQIILSEAVIYVASSPKSNSACNAIFAANEVVRSTVTAKVPAHLQDAHYKGSAKLGHGIGYKYAHDYPNHYVKQQYLPDGLEDSRFYEPGDLGYEVEVKNYFKKIKED